MNDEQLDTFRHNTPQIVIENLTYVEGDGVVENKSNTMGDITSSNFGPNTNFQGDNVKQVNVTENPILDEALTELKSCISNLSDEDHKDNAEMHYEMLVESIEENKPSRVERCLNFLKDTLGAIASITTIAMQCGITI